MIFPKIFRFYVAPIIVRLLDLARQSIVIERFFYEDSINHPEFHLIISIHSKVKKEETVTVHNRHRKESNIPNSERIPLTK